MNTCRTCKFYSTTPEVTINFFDGTTATEKPEGECSCPKFRYVYSAAAQLADDELGYWDFEGYAAGFNVGPDFGCIHWEAK